MAILVWFILFFQDITQVFGLRCLECSDIPTPTDCNRITTCGPTESCYVEQVVTSGGVVLYNNGCRSHFRCAGTPGKRFLASSTDIVTCSQCCNSEFCNLGGCGISALSPPQRGIYCFECDAQKTPDSCRDIVMCDFGYTCLLEKGIDATQPFYRSYCIEEKACKALEQVATVSGRRRQSVDHCPMCCRDDFCNDNCRQNITGSPSTSTSLILSTQPTRSTSYNNSTSPYKSPASAKFASLVHVTASSSAKSTVAVKSTLWAYSSPTSKSATLTGSTSLTVTKTAGNSVYPKTITAHSTVNPTAITAHFTVNPTAITAHFTVNPTAITAHSTVYPTAITAHSTVNPTTITAHSTVNPTAITSHITVNPTTITSHITVNPTAITSHSTMKPVTVDFHWSPWGTWSVCHCHHAFTQSRHRLCVHGHHNQHHCPGSGTDIRPCVQPNRCHTFVQTSRHTTTGPAQHCDTSSGYHLVKGHSAIEYMCFKLYSNPKRWTHAKAQCHDESQGQGHLIILDSPAKEKTLTMFLRDMHAYSTLNAIWMGMSYQHKAWQWVTGAGINTHNSHTVRQFVSQNTHPHFHCAARMLDETLKPLQCLEEHEFVCEISM